MALRSRTRTATAASGPGRGPCSDSRTRHRRPPARRGARHRRATAEEVRRRAEALFGEHTGPVGESGSGPPISSGRDTRDTRLEPVRPTRRKPSWAEGDPVDSTTDDVDPGPTDGPTPNPADGLMPDPADGPDPGRADGLMPDPADGPDPAPADDVAPRGPAGTGPADAPDAPGAGRREWRERAGLALRERMPLWLQTRCGLERRNVVALTVVLAVAAVFALQHFWTGRTQSVRAPEVVRAVASHGREETRFAASGVSAASPGPAGSAGGSAGGEIVVDVVGKVRHPGIHRLPAGSRVVDALAAAGGVRPGTSTDGLNRARFLVDGEQVVVGGAAPAPDPASGGTTGGVTTTGGSTTGAPSAPVSLNSATAEQLETLPGVGPVLARHILDYRTQHGGFRSVDELRQVNGIGARRFADLRSMVRP
ncbi:helix-hairpin-helix domain-containing protein [Streptomyces sp. Li-HN-5-11]|uniref:helix-hairpin-helix domain-containing protein n=1 Tax=Streptomyces sp. Li-HN-5-11 TaxID=3075432 RepID=UPI0028A8325C|nr:helix-hairpin-helix domain-containing protein [Streptomyces sp. Li-HN-5-11]WNM35066.1 helix-hairpin-helix domain-containing protein [Streptomyces sp. Li-HN-5-11]